MNPEVIIIGCGPVGALAANLLGACGVSTLVLEREAAEYHLPRAAHFDGEVMRIFQAAGLDTKLEGVVRSFDGMDLISATGRPLLQFRTSEESRVFSHPVANLFYQPELERVLRRGMARFDCVELRSLTEVMDIRQHDDGVEVTTTAVGTGEQATIETQYVLGCDGARSFTRKTIGSGMEDLGLHQPWLVLDLIMKRAVALPDIAIQVCDPKRPATLIPFPAPRRRWEFMLMPGETPEQMTSLETIHRLVQPWVAPADYEIERAAVYTFHGLIARPWSLGRVFLLGDAAHQTPPFLGQGMCAGIRDAFNLCWKLEHVLHRGANAALLQSYEVERYPHVKAVIELAIRLGRIIQSKNRVLGLIRNTGFRLAKLISGDAVAPDSASTLSLGNGFFDMTSANTAKRIPFPQPRVANLECSRALLDDCLGRGFSLLLLDRDPADVLTPASADCAREIGMPVLRVGAESGNILDTDGRLGAWFQTQRVQAVFLRPDRVPYGAYDLTKPASRAALNAAIIGVGAACFSYTETVQ